MTNALTSSVTADPWMQEMHAALRSAADFVIAYVTHSQDLVEIAGKVLCSIDGKFMSVAEIETQCSAHGWNSMIYEAWQWERRNQVFSAAKKLVPYECDALLLYAESQESLAISQSDAYDAIDEARRELYGDLDSDDGCDLDHNYVEDFDSADFA